MGLAMQVEAEGEAIKLEKLFIRKNGECMCSVWYEDNS